MGVPKQDHIIIVGAGAFGLSTALHLSQNGYSNITVFEQDNEIPSRYSAANDLNKIMRVEYEDPWYTNLTIEASEAWKTPLFSPFFHRVGFLHCVSGKAEQKAVDTLNRFRGAAENHPGLRRFVVPLDSKDDIQDATWQLQGPLPGWKGYLNRFDGYTHAADALRAVHRAAKTRGVRFVLDRTTGAVEEIVYDMGGSSSSSSSSSSSNSGKRAKGVRTKDGRFHPASLVIVAAGAVASRLVAGAGQFVHAKSWSVAHIQLTPEESSSLRGIPVVYARDLGFFFEPDPVTHLLKLCPMGAGFVNTDGATGLSLPPAQHADSTGFLPADDEAKLRELLRQTIPALAGRPFVQKSLCWFADTADSDFVVDYVPGSSSSVVLLSGDSGHGFKMFPIVGRWVTELLASPSGQTNSRWRWKAQPPKTEADWGSAVSWRVGTTTEFADIRRAGPAGRESKL
ncbi:hypothetical protein DHEL01_v206382 [Diaporthe helianthi]|uniref:FAD dependent oxidoreductase domain-containing protein n=1 Tax=Diaporthe helianthi TaxID=158607 RepID=A0A2P5HYA1_DIAHE|nr:hypothetical protein DHEL01_v206382 [Diaporthe helianthi]